MSFSLPRQSDENVHTATTSLSDTQRWSREVSRSWTMILQEKKTTALPVKRRTFFSVTSRTRAANHSETASKASSLSVVLSADGAVGPAPPVKEVTDATMSLKVEKSSISSRDNSVSDTDLMTLKAAANSRTADTTSSQQVMGELVNPRPSRSSSIPVSRIELSITAKISCPTASSSARYVDPSVLHSPSTQLVSSMQVVRKGQSTVNSHSAQSILRLHSQTSHLMQFAPKCLLALFLASLFSIACSCLLFW